jgi:hypothetical protein
MMTSTLPLVTIAVVTFLFNDDFNFTTSNYCCSNVFLLQQGLLVVKLKSSLSKNVTTAIVTSGKVEVIIKQKRYYSKEPLL